MSNSDYAINNNKAIVLTNEAIMPRSKTLIFEEPDRRQKKGLPVAIWGFCHEAYAKEISLPLPNNM